MIFHQRRRPSEETTREVTALLARHDPQRVWLRAHERWRDALENLHWLDDPELRDRSRYWHGVMREIERQTGYRPPQETPRVNQ